MNGKLFRAGIFCPAQLFNVLADVPVCPADGAAPADEAAPADGAAPADEAAPADGAVPADEAALADGAVPADGVAPADDALDGTTTRMEEIFLP